MNIQISQIITIILNNRIVCVDTNIRDLRKQFLKIEPEFWKYDRLYARLRKEPYTLFETEGKEYHIELTKTK